MRAWTSERRAVPEEPPGRSELVTIVLSALPGSLRQSALGEQGASAFSDTTHLFPGGTAARSKSYT